MKDVLYMSNVQEGMDAIMNILEGAEPIAALVPVTVYDGRGHVASVNGKNVVTGYNKGQKRIKTPKDELRALFLDAAQVLLNREVSFAGKVGRNSTEGVIVKMADADYAVKCTGHAKPEYKEREKNFIATKNFMTRGKVPNHASKVAKVLVSEIENGFSKSVFENKSGYSVILLAASASVVRFGVTSLGLYTELSFKVTKKQARIVAN